MFSINKNGISGIRISKNRIYNDIFFFDLFIIVPSSFKVNLFPKWINLLMPNGTSDSISRSVVKLYISLSTSLKSLDIDFGVPKT